MNLLKLEIHLCVCVTRSNIFPVMSPFSVVIVYTFTFAGEDECEETGSKAENPFMHMSSACVTYAACKHVTFSTFNMLNVFAVVQWRREVNLIT